MAASFTDALVEIVGTGHVLTGPGCAPFVVEGRTPCAVVLPGHREEAARVLVAAAARRVPIMPWGGGTQMALGTPPQEGALVVATRRLSRVVEHAPGDLTATVEAGLTLGELDAALATRGQWWPLDPPRGAQATLGGVLASNASGPRRHLYGTARDLVLGLTVITPAGELVRAGGRVVKNVAGYDLVKLHLGALGTLGLLVEATLKLRPRPEASGALLVGFDDLLTAGGAAGQLLRSPLQPHAVELLSARAAAGVAREAACTAPEGRAALLVGVDGLAATVDWQLEEAMALARRAGASSLVALPEPQAARALAAAGDPAGIAGHPRAVTRISLLPARVVAYLVAAEDRVAAAGLGLTAAAHVGEGSLGVALTAPGLEPDARVVGQVLTDLRRSAQAAGGHLVVEWAPLAVKEQVPVWDPEGPGRGLMRAIKTRLDPEGVMNPGRFLEGL